MNYQIIKIELRTQDVYAVLYTCKCGQKRSSAGQWAFQDIAEKKAKKLINQVCECKNL